VKRKQYTRPIVKDTESDDLILDLGDELCRDAGWKVGDRLEWIDQGNGTWILRKITWRTRWKNFVKLLETLRLRK
jgi:hypothetical protein